MKTNIKSQSCSHVLFHTCFTHGIYQTELGCPSVWFCAAVFRLRCCFSFCCSMFFSHIK